MKCVDDFNLVGKKVILRCDFNVSISDGRIVDDTRIIKSLKTINYILDKGAKLIILSHLGKVKTIDDKEKYSMRIVYNRLKELLNDKISFVPFTRDNLIYDYIEKLDYGCACLLENTRYEDLNGKKESNCDMGLAKFWASLGDIFINDAFGTLHRGHASNLGISNYLPSGIGFLVVEEINYLKKLDNPVRDYVVIMGGAKVSDKILVIDKIIRDVDKLFIGGAMAFTFLKSMGKNVGASLVEDDYVDYCKNLLTKYREKIVLPIDFYGSYTFSNDSEKIYLSIDNIDDNFIGMDIGDATVDMFSKQLDNVKTVFWNGPMGVYEFSNYKEGTKKLMDKVSGVETSILGGGDIVSCCMEFGYLDKISYVSTGGGATLEYLVNKNLPGLTNIK